MNIDTHTSQYRFILCVSTTEGDSGIVGEESNQNFYDKSEIPPDFQIFITKIKVKPVIEYSIKICNREICLFISKYILQKKKQFFISFVDFEYEEM